MSVENLKYWYDKDGNKVFGEVNGKKQHYNKCFEYLMSNNPEDVLSKRGIKIRRIFHPIFTKLLPLTTKNKLKVVRRAPIPKDRPVIFALSHGFRDDIAVGLKTIKKHAYLAYASLPDFYYSIDGLALWANGVYIMDRKDKESKKALIPKIIKAHELGQNYHAICVEGVWNKDPNELILELWKGFYLASREIGALVMPVVMLNKDMDIDNDKNKTCYSSLGEAVDLVKYADNITLKQIRKMSIIETKPKKIIKKVRDIHDIVDLYEKQALEELGEIIDYKKIKKEEVLKWIRQVSLLSLPKTVKELLEKTNQPELYCDPELVHRVEKILKKMNSSKFEALNKLDGLINLKKYTVSEAINLLEDIWNIVEESDREAINYFRSIMVFDKLDLYKEYSNYSNSTSFSRANIKDAEEYWDNYIKELIKTSHGLYDYSIENSAEFINKNKVSEKEVFQSTQNIELTKENAKVYFKTRNIYEKKKKYFE